MTRILIPILARLHPYNWRRKRWEYPQLWAVANRLARRLTGKNRKRYRTLKGIIEWVCGVITKHEISKTEWEYGGGNFVDRHCRWCDKTFKIPKREEYVPHGLEDMVNELGWEET